MPSHPEAEARTPNGAVSDADRLAHAREGMAAADFWRINSEPPLARWLMGLGLLNLLPHYQPFWRNVLWSGAWFGPVWGVGMWLLFWRGEGMAWGPALGMAVLAGAGFGIWMATQYRRSPRRHGLGRWEDLGRGSRPDDAQRCSKAR